MLPTLQAFMVVHRLTDITVVADAGMLSEANKREIEAAGLGFILGNRFTHIPYVIDEWRKQNPSVEIPDGLILTQPWPPGPNSTRRDQVIYYQYRADRARRTLKRHRRTDRQSRTRRRREDAAQAEPVHHPDRRRQEREPRPRDQGTIAGRAGRATSPTSPTRARSS